MELSMAIGHAPRGMIRCRAMFRGIALSMILSFIMLAIPTLPATAQNYSSDTLSVSINFRQGRSNLDLSFMGNKEALDSFVKAYNSQPNKPTFIYIKGYASPEGTVAINQRLSRQRADAISNYLKTNCNISADSLVSVPIGVDWEDLYTAVESDPNVPAREKVLDIITNVTDIVRDSRGVLISQRNHLLQQLEHGRTWSYMLNHLYPNLRGARAKVVCIVDQPEPEQAALPAETETSAQVVEETVAPPRVSSEDSLLTAQNALLPEHFLRYPIAAVRSNMLLPLLNVGVEVPVAKHWSIAADYYYPWFWPASKNKNCFELIFVSAEARYWFNPCKGEVQGKNYLVGHSVAAYGAWGYYDFERNYHGHQGNFYSAGLDYVYALPIAKGKLRLEFQLAGGAVWSPKALPYNVFQEGGHLVHQKGVHKNFFYLGPTKIGVSLVMPINRKVKRSNLPSL